MARLKKDQKVDTIKHRSGLVVDIFFDPNHGDEHGLTFHATVGSMRFRNAKAAELKQEVHNYLNANLNLAWHPVIIVSEVAPFSPGKASFVGIEVERAYMANGADGRIRQISWQDYEATPDGDESTDSFRLQRARECWRGLKKVPDDLPHTSKSSDKEVHILSYDAALYAGLVEIGRGIDRLKDKLRGLLSDGNGWAQVAAIGAQLTKLLPESNTGHH